MEVLDLRNRLIGDYAKFVRSLIAIRDERIAEYVGRSTATDQLRLGLSFGPELLPHPPLLAPVEDCGNGAEVTFADGVAALGRAGQEQEFFLP